MGDCPVSDAEKQLGQRYRRETNGHLSSGRLPEIAALPGGRLLAEPFAGPDPITHNHVFAIKQFDHSCSASVYPVVLDQERRRRVAARNESELIVKTATGALHA
jgi:hypothetical protein